MELIGIWWIIIGLLIFIGLIFFPLKLAVRLQREPNHLQVTIRFYIWLWPVKLRFVNPLSKIIQGLSTNRFWKKKMVDELDAKDVSWRRLFARVELFHTHILPIYHKINGFYHRIFHPIKLRQLSLATEIGLEDAAITALSVGAIWSLWGFIYPKLAKVFNTEEAKIQIDVTPNFQQSSYLVIDYSCIFEFRLGHIMIIVYYLLRNMGEIRKTLRRMSK